MGGGRLVGLTTEVGYRIECTSLMYATEIMAIACYSTFSTTNPPMLLFRQLGWKLKHQVCIRA